MTLVLSRGTSMRATGNVSAQDHGFTAWPVATVAAKARSSRICASMALAWIQIAWPNSTSPAAASTTAMLMRSHRRLLGLVKYPPPGTLRVPTSLTRGEVSPVALLSAVSSPRFPIRQGGAAHLAVFLTPWGGGLGGGVGYG